MKWSRKIAGIDIPCHTLPVLGNGRPVGVVTTDPLGEFRTIQDAPRERMRGAA